MCERQNMILCAFDLRRPRISAYEIRELIYDQMCDTDKVVTITQMDGPKRHMHINFRDNWQMKDVFCSTGWQVEYRRSNSEISAVWIITTTECRCQRMDNL